VIAFLQGNLIEVTGNRIVIDVNGVGYEVSLSGQSAKNLPDIGQGVRVLTYQHVREDVLALYGFLSGRERDLFKLLLSISGIGPKVAMNILSGITAEDFYLAVRNGDRMRLSGIPGLGKKNAERILVELKEKAILLSSQWTGKAALIEDARHGDATRALIALGYKQNKAQSAVEKAMGQKSAQKATVEELIKDALQWVNAQ
jgi:holliday junction DNA helicase RuvA